MQQTIEFQIRFDNGCLEFFEAECIQGLKRAIKMYQTNKDFWKISFTGLDNIRYRIRPKYKPQYENNEDENFWESSENKLCVCFARYISNLNRFSMISQLRFISVASCNYSVQIGLNRLCHSGSEPDMCFFTPMNGIAF